MKQLSIFILIGMTLLSYYSADTILHSADTILHSGDPTLYGSDTTSYSGDTTLFSSDSDTTLQNQYISSYLQIKNSLLNQNAKTNPQHFVELDATPYSLEDIVEDILFATTHYAGIATRETIGNSFEGRPIYAVKIGVPSENNKPCILLMSNIHAREDFSSMLTMKSLDYILYNYYETGYWGNYDLNEILSKIDIYFIPVANPDGLNIAHHGINASANYEFLQQIPDIAEDSRWWKANGRGVDLNRNFNDGNWEIKRIGTHHNGYASEGYKGKQPNSEPETKAIQEFCIKKQPLMAVSYHTSGEVLFWADTDTHSKLGNLDTKVIENIHAITGYKVMPVSQDPVTFGSGFENWFKSTFHRFGFVIELAPYPGKSFMQHADEQFDELVWTKAKYTGIELARNALLFADKYYDVQLADGMIKTFYNEDSALSYAQEFEHAVVVFKNKTLVSFNKRVK